MSSEIRVTDLIKKYSDNKVGEILLTSVRNDGTLKGVDEELLELCLKLSEVPVIYSGGLIFEDANKLKKYPIDEVTVSSSYYYKIFSHFLIRSFGTERYLSLISTLLGIILSKFGKDSNGAHGMS